MVDYGWNDIKDFIVEYKDPDIYPDLVTMSEVFDIKKFEEDYKRIKKLGFYLVDMTKKYPLFKEWVCNKYNIKEEKGGEHNMEWESEYMHYTEHDCETFIGFVCKMRRQFKENDYDTSELDFIDKFIEAYEEPVTEHCFPMTERFPQFKDYMKTIYGHLDPEIKRREILFRKFKEDE